MLVLSLLILVVLTAFAPVACRLSRRFGSLFVAAVPGALGVWFASAAPGVVEGTAVSESWAWIPDLGLDLALRLDGLSLTFALLICFISSGVLLYASSYMGEHPRLGSFLSVLTAFTASMLGLVLSDNLILLFIFWELTSITSFLLIGFEHGRESARKAALQALLTTGLGGLALLAGVVLVGIASGGWTISEAVSTPMHDSVLYVPIVVLLLVGALTKSANFPFHYWLPNAMEAPSPVSALLHSATMVKAGVYLIARMHPAMSGSAIWDMTLVVIGGVTMVLGAFLATRQDQLKKILAYSTVSSLGILVMLIGLGAAKAAAVYLLAHAFFKGCLFLVAGTLTELTGEKNPDKLGGLVRGRPVFAFTAVFAGLSMAGMFPMIGFVGKELMLKGSLAHPEWALATTVATVFAAALTVMVSWLVAVRPFVMRAPDGFDPGVVGGVAWRQLVAPVGLSLLGLVAGLAPGVFAEPIVGSIVASIEPSHAGDPVHLSWLKMVWPVSLPLFLSVGALAVGSVLFFGRRMYRGVTDWTRHADAVGPERGYQVSLAGLLALAKGHTRVMQNGSMQVYVRVMLLTVVGLVGASLWRTFDWAVIPGFVSGVSELEAMLVLALFAAAFSAVIQNTALATVACLSGVGFVIAILFALYGAPDLAMTQFAVETLMLIIFVLVLFHLPRYRNLSGRGSRVFDVVLSGLFGLLFTCGVIAALSQPYSETIAAYHAENAYDKAYGRNVVNVILVDFRALDTLGEVFVIGVASIGVYTLLRLRAARETVGREAAA